MCTTPVQGSKKLNWPEIVGEDLRGEVDILDLLYRSKESQDEVVFYKVALAH